MKLAWSAAGALVVFVLASAGPAAESGVFSGGPMPVRPRIVNGLETREYATVGILLSGVDPDTATLLCSGTMIGCETFLTAAHCVEGDSNPAHYAVFLQHAGFFTVSSVTSHPDYSFPMADTAVLKLSAPVTGVAPTPINNGASPAFGTAGVIVGFGRAGGGDYDYGLKRYGAVTTAACVGGISDLTSVCWNFESPLGPPGTDSNTCNGDSGGPLLIDFGSGDTVAGVTSGGYTDDCLPEDVSYDANVFHYRTWIETQGGADLGNTRCGTMPQVGEPGTTVVALSGELDSVNRQAAHTVEVPTGATRLRISMNAADDGAADFDLYVKAGSPATTTDFDCAANGPNQLGFCEFTSAALGTWYVLVDRYQGSGRYQATATIFGIDCSQPGNEGLPCEDGNSCTGPDTCQAAVCNGPALADGTACSDGSLCTWNDTCQSGACASGASPATGCKFPSVPGKAFLRVRNRTADDRDRVVWRWRAGSATTKAEFGDPAGGSGYALCLYDEIDGVPHLVSEIALPTGAKWSELDDGFKYRDGSRKVRGVKRVRLKAGDDGKARIELNAKGAELGLGDADPYRQDGKLTVQLVSEGTCWEADYSTNIANDGMLFKARGD